MKKWNVGWGPIAACNMNCQFCYSIEKRQHKSCLSLDTWKHFVDENHAAINSINYGTGENTLSRDWFPLVLYVRQKYPEIRQALTTNGYLASAVEDRFCREAFVIGIDEEDVSLDFANPEQHNRLRGQSQAYTWALKTLNLCQKDSKPATIVFLGSNVNDTTKNIEGLFNIAREKHVKLRMNIFRPTLGMDDRSKKFLLNFDVLVQILMYIYTHLEFPTSLLPTMLQRPFCLLYSGQKKIALFRMLQRPLLHSPLPTH